MLGKEDVIVRIQINALVLFMVSMCLGLRIKKVPCVNEHCLPYAVEKVGVQFSPPDKLHCEYKMDAIVFVY